MVPGSPQMIGPGLIAELFAVAIDGFAVAFHVALLKIGRKTMHVLIIGQNGFRLGAEEIVVPDADQGQHDRNIFFKRACS